MIENPSYCFLINSSSNASKAGEIISQYKKRINQLFPKSELIFIGKEDSIAEISASKATVYSHIVACGGDGTVNKVINGIIGKRVVLGVIPVGSGNDFAKSLGLTNNIDDSLRILKEAKVRTIDVINTDSGYFVNTFGMGLDGLTNFYASKSSFKHGILRYFFGGLKALFQADPFDVSVFIPELSDTIAYRSWMVTVANGKIEGGRYTISPFSSNYDGKIEIIVVKDITRFRLAYEFIKLSLGIPFNKNIVDIIVTKKGGKIVSNSRVKTHADGEQIKSRKVNKFKLLTSSVNVIYNDLIKS